MTQLNAFQPAPTAPHPGALAHEFAREWTSRELVDIARAERAAQERDLVARLLADDAAAWRFFTREYSRVIIGSIRRVLARFSRVVGDHDVDEVYARFCFELLSHNRKKLRAFDPDKGSRLSSWIGLLASNAAYDYLRRVKRDRVCDPLPESDTMMAATESPFELVELAQRAALTAEVMTQLSDRDRQFVQLFFGEGLEAEEVAERMNISVKTVYTKRHKITARLESLLGAQA